MRADRDRGFAAGLAPSFPQAIVAELRASGVKLSMAGDWIRVIGVDGRSPSRESIDRITANREAIVALLRSEATCDAAAHLCPPNNPERVRSEERPLRVRKHCSRYHHATFEQKMAAAVAEAIEGLEPVQSALRAEMLKRSNFSMARASRLLMEIESTVLYGRGSGER